MIGKKSQQNINDHIRPGKKSETGKQTCHQEAEKEDEHKAPQMLFVIIRKVPRIVRIRDQIIKQNPERKSQHHIANRLLFPSFSQKRNPIDHSSHDQDDKNHQ